MWLWVFVVLILLSASFVAMLAWGPLKVAPQANALRTVALVQFLLALLLAGARLMGRA